MPNGNLNTSRDTSLWAGQPVQVYLDPNTFETGLLLPVGTQVRVNGKRGAIQAVQDYQYIVRYKSGRPRWVAFHFVERVPDLELLGEPEDVYVR